MVATQWLGLGCNGDITGISLPLVTFARQCRSVPAGPDEAASVCPPGGTHNGNESGSYNFDVLLAIYHERGRRR